RGAWSVLERRGRPERGHQAVTDPLDGIAPETNDLLLNQIEAPVGQLHQVGGGHSLAQAGEARDVGEEHGRPAALEAGSRRVVEIGRSLAGRGQRTQSRLKPGWFRGSPGAPTGSL